jgi:hypothetical protein
MALVGHPVWPIRLPICPRLAPRLAAHHCRTFAKPLHNHCKTITKSLQNQTGAPPSGPIGSPVCPRQVPRLPQSGPRLPPSTPIWPLSIAKPDGGQTGADGGPDVGPDGVADRDYLLLKGKMTCSIYVSCKSSSASDVSDARWM